MNIVLLAQYEGAAQAGQVLGETTSTGSGTPTWILILLIAGFTAVIFHFTLVKRIKE